MAQLRGRIDNTDRLARTLRDVAIRATEDPFRRTRRVLSSGLPEIGADSIADRQIIAKDFRTALNVGDSEGGVRFNSAGIEGYNSSVDQTFDIGTDGSGFLGLGATQITWGTTGTVDVPGGALTPGSVEGSKIANDTITNALLKAGAQPYNSTVEFSGTAYNAYSWTSGNIAFGDGATQAINTGSNTGLSNNTTYYVYATFGSATLSQTTTYTDVFADDRVLLAMIVVGTSSSGSEPTILPFNAKGLTISAVAISANAIIADAIQAGTITADKMNVDELSAITADLGTVTAGTLTSATIRSAASGNRVEINSSGITLHGPTQSLFQFRAVADSSVVGEMYANSLGIGIQATEILMTGITRISGTVQPDGSGSGAIGTSGSQFGSASIQSVAVNSLVAIGTGIQIHTSAGSNAIGFYGATPVSRQVVSGARNDPEAALADLIATLNTLGLIVDNTTAS